MRMSSRQVQPRGLIPESDPLRRVLLVLLVSSVVGTVLALAGHFFLANPLELDAAVALGIAAGVLTGVLSVDSTRPRLAGDSANQATELKRDSTAAPQPKRWIRFRRTFAAAAVPLRRLRGAKPIRIGTGVAGVLALAVVLFAGARADEPEPAKAAIAAGAYLLAAGLAAMVARYLAAIDPDRLPESTGLARGARILTWILVLAAVSIGLASVRQHTALWALHVAVVIVIGSVCAGFFSATSPRETARPRFPLDGAALAAFGSRMNVAASVLDAGQRQFGIDLRSTWALTVIRRNVVPLIVSLCAIGWLSTSLTVVRMDEAALVERLGVALQEQPLDPGLHLHWPWPIDHVFRVPVRRVQTMAIGSEGSEPQNGPEDVLWARQHVANEYTLLLGDGRDLITIDAAVQFRIVDPRAWRYQSQNPDDALRAIAYRAVMRSTVDRTLAEVLSEQLVKTTTRMRTMVQQEADALGLGVEILGLTVGGMHPPVEVAADYQAVISAQLYAAAAVATAHGSRSSLIPAAEAAVLTGANEASAEGAEALGRAAGEAWSFRALESQYHAEPAQFFFRRRLETLEQTLAGRKFTVVDSRFQRDGGELWVR
jgi:regulator of protease activity HflC (stomatin/prohibitin superfamily)